MGKAYIFNEYLDDDDRAALEKAVKAAGYDAVYGVPTNISSVDPDADIGVVGLPTAPDDMAIVDTRIQAFVGAGIRVVGIWLRGEDYGEGGIPDGIGKYGMTVDIGSAEIGNTLKGETDVWEKTGGTLNPMPKTKRNKC